MGANALPARSFSHVALCVSDIERSARFYCGALGFVRNESYEFGNEPRKLMEIDAELRFRSQFLGLGGVRLELLQFLSPEPINPGGRRPMYTFGFTHLAVRVRDLEEAIASVREHGGSVLEHTRTRLSMEGYDCEMIYCTDPDGQRIELLWMPESVHLA